ncbi:phage terminase Nu1 subunit (DNA packaging protein) [Bradyrhizobium sp. LM2.7]
MSTISQVCKWCGISRPTFHRALNRGVVAKKPRGQYDVQEVARALIKDGQAAKGGHGDYASKLALSEARAALARAQTAALRMKNAIRRREYLSAVQRQVEIIFAAFRERILSIPDKLAAVCEMRSRVEVELVLRDECWEVLEELSRPIIPMDGEAMSPTPTAPSPPVVSKR